MNKTKLILKLSLSLLVLLLTMSISSLTVYAWGPGTHTLFGRELGVRYGVRNLLEMYGSVVPDMFNLMFGYEHQEYLWGEAHYEFMKVVDVARFCRRNAFAYGFAGHNRESKADYMADDIGVGYVTAKSGQLGPLLEDGIEAFLIAKGIPYTNELVEELALRLASPNIEFAVDLLVSREIDPYGSSPIFAVNLVWG